MKKFLPMVALVFLGVPGLATLFFSYYAYAADMSDPFAIASNGLWFCFAIGWLVAVWFIYLNIANWVEKRDD